MKSRSKSESKRSLSLEDFWSLKSVNDPQISPHGRLVAYVVGRLDEETNKAKNAIWVLNLEDGSSRQITSGEASDTSPRWAPDSRRLAFVSTRHEKKKQIFILDLAGGEPRRITDVKNEAGSPIWSPDGSTICFSSDVESDRQEVSQETAWMEAHKEADQDTDRMRLINTLLGRIDGRGYVDSRTHLFLVPSEGSEAEPRQLTDGDYDDAEGAWSPDGGLIAFASNRTADRERNFASDIWTVDVESGDLKRLTDGSLTATSPSWSPDGRQIAFYGEPEWIANGYQQTHVWLVSREGGDQRDATKGFDRSVSPAGADYMTPAAKPPAWSPNGRTIYLVVADGRFNRVFSLLPARKRPSPVPRESLQVSSVSVTPDGRNLICLGLAPDRPAELFRISIRTGVEERLTHANDDLFAEIALVTPEHVVFRGPGGWKIDGWLTRPADSSGPDPLILHVHGGPQGRYSDTFYFLFQALAAQGYASLYINPRGSVGYGFDFAKAADWGLKDYRDLMAGVQQVCERADIDGDRMAVTGVSYGGFMTNWVLSHSDRFRTGVSINGIASMFSMFGSSDVTSLWFEREFGGPFWSSEAQWRRYHDHSPITYVENLKAPLLLLQSENDYRCPIEEGELMLTALRMLDRTVEMVRIPNASHVLTNSGTPHQRYLRWKLTLDWFDKYVKGDPAR